MFVVLLRFSDNRARAAELVDGHNAWIQQGFDDGVFLVTGNLQPSLGGGVVAHNTSRADLERRIQEDPFVAQDVVRAEIIEITPSRADERLGALPL